MTEFMPCETMRDAMNPLVLADIDSGIEQRFPSGAVTFSVGDRESIPDSAKMRSVQRLLIQGGPGSRGVWSQLTSNFGAVGRIPAINSYRAHGAYVNGAHMVDGQEITEQDGSLQDMVNPAVVDPSSSDYIPDQFLIPWELGVSGGDYAQDIAGTLAIEEPVEYVMDGLRLFRRWFWVGQGYGQLPSQNPIEGQVYSMARRGDVYGPWIYQDMQRVMAKHRWLALRSNSQSVWSSQNRVWTTGGETNVTVDVPEYATAVTFYEIRYNVLELSSGARWDKVKRVKTEALSGSAQQYIYEPEPPPGDSALANGYYSVVWVSWIFDMQFPLS